MPALIDTRFIPDLKAKYQQLIAAGKPAKIAIAAVMRNSSSPQMLCPKQTDFGANPPLDHHGYVSPTPSVQSI